MSPGEYRTLAGEWRLPCSSTTASGIWTVLRQRSCAELLVRGSGSAADTTDGFLSSPMFCI